MATEEETFHIVEFLGKTTTGKGDWRNFSQGKNGDKKLIGVWPAIGVDQMLMHDKYEEALKGYTDHD